VPGLSYRVWFDVSTWRRIQSTKFIAICSLYAFCYCPSPWHKFSHTGILQHCSRCSVLKYEDKEIQSAPSSSCDFVVGHSSVISEYWTLRITYCWCAVIESMLWRSGDRIPVGARFSAPIQTSLGSTQPPLQWVLGLSRGVKQPGRGFDYPPSSIAEVEGIVILHNLLPLWAFVACSRVNF